MPILQPSAFPSLSPPHRLQAIWGAAIANADSSCFSALGGCRAISNALAVAVGGPAISNSQSICRGAGCSANANSQSISVVSAVSAGAAPGGSMQLTSTRPKQHTCS
jgi:hypothetical protein